MYEGQLLGTAKLRRGDAFLSLDCLLYRCNLRTDDLIVDEVNLAIQVFLVVNQHLLHRVCTISLPPSPHMAFDCRSFMKTHRVKIDSHGVLHVPPVYTFSIRKRKVFRQTFHQSQSTREMKTHIKFVFPPPLPIAFVFFVGIDTVNWLEAEIF
ncbi:unnamed protein product [Lactuca saligna]|uniref:Uncharacterized protein n=1 Tax=Lactuca saligna TaxID=75948 RepID=A0AA35ZJM1_LACSI|nr:unnamed protein product [Lactuca saligna]